MQPQALETSALGRKRPPAAAAAAAAAAGAGHAHLHATRTGNGLNVEQNPWLMSFQPEQ